MTNQTGQVRGGGTRDNGKQTCIIHFQPFNEMHWMLLDVSVGGDVFCHAKMCVKCNCKNLPDV